MVEKILIISTIIMALSIVITAIRFYKGPTAVDRVIAFDIITIISLSIMGVITFFLNRAIYFDIIIVYALLSFLGVIMIARYFEGGL